MKISKFFDGSVNLKLGKKNFVVNKKLFAGIIALVLVAIIVLLSVFGGSEKASAQLITAQVTRGDIVSSIEGTGVIEAINQYEITSLAKGDIMADYFEEGDYVEKDQLLYEMDASSVTSSIERAQSNYEKAQMNYDNAIEDVENLNIKADISGVITSLKIKKGDQVGANTVVAEIIDREVMLLKIPFNTIDSKNLYVGQSATVNVEGSFTTASGKITRIATGSVINSYGAAVTNVEVEVPNPGSIVPGDKATVVAGDYACNDAGTFEYKNESVITAKVSGKISYINYFEGDKISKGSVIAVIESDSVNSSARTSRLSLNDARSSLKDAQETLDDYSIRAPIAGKVIEKNAKAGEKLDTNSSSTMAIIADLSSLVFEMSIDELDIRKIQVGQQVNITADAIEGTTFTGSVTSVSIVGSSSQGVTSYPVKVTIENGEESGLIPGMNVTGNIIVDTVEDVLRVPVSAVRRGNFVIVKDDGTVGKTDKANKEKTDGDSKENRKFDGEMPEGMEGKMPQGEMPEGMRERMPQGEMPEGMRERMQQGERPEGMNGERPQRTRPEGEIPQKAPTDAQGSPTSAPKGTEDKISGILDWFTTKVFAAPEEDAEKMAARLENMKKQLNVPAGYTIVRVETGLSNDTFIEIKSGLSEGQTVLLPDTTASTTNNANQRMMGGMGGGMPMGGMGGRMPMGGNMNRNAGGNMRSGTSGAGSRR